MFDMDKLNATQYEVKDFNTGKSYGPFPTYRKANEKANRLDLKYGACTSQVKQVA